MKLSTKGRYGLRAIIDLARYSETEPVSISSIAARQEISERYLEQLVALMKKAGLVKSIRGASGGYVLARPAAEISVGDVLRALEGSLEPVKCPAILPGSTRNQNAAISQNGGSYMEKLIYLDNAATTQTAPEVVEAMLPYFTEKYGNPSSVYGFASANKEALNLQRDNIAEVLGAKSNEIYFTAGGTESDNWALKATAEAYRDKGNHIITTKIEHHAILHSAQFLEKHGFEVTYVDVDENGVVKLDQLEAAIRPETILISVMFANNEIGTIQPIKEIGKIAHDRGILFHTDAVQAFGHVPINVDECHIDMLSASGHKLNGPKGIGFLYIRKGVKIRSFIR